MSLILGIDTGGTYTDSIILDTETQAILCKAKSFTTHQNLLIGILDSLDSLHFPGQNDISMVCLSTTLATNAVVEHQGCRVGALLTGRSADSALPAVHTYRLQGLMNIKGRIIEDISPSEISLIAQSWKGKVDAVAVSGFASVRNPLHEIRIRDIVRQELHVPVVCAHELSTSLGFHERTVTAVLNAALIPNISNLIDSMHHAMAQRGISAPLMIVKGDGSLMRSEFALERPIETVLSGPAASIAGGLFLSDVKDALILDMGGTTTDIALVEHGKVSINDSGAMIGGWRTQLRAAEISTFGLGGDSRIYLSPEHKFTIGPTRVLPLCIAGAKYPYLTEELVTYQPAAEYELFQEQPCECYAFLRQPLHRPASENEQRLFDLLANGPHSLFYLAHQMDGDAEKLGITALVNEGALQRIGLTPTDLLHISGELNLWNSDTAKEGARQMAEYLSLSLDQFTIRFFGKMQERLRECCVQASINFSGVNYPISEQTARFFLHNKGKLFHSEIYLDYPVVALGAPVAAWLPQVCQSLHTELLIPEHAEVANAIGAAVGQIILTATALIRPDQHHNGYIVHTNWGNKWFEQLSDAESWAQNSAKECASRKAIEAGGENCTVNCSSIPTYSHAITGQTVFIQTKIVATAIARPHYTEKEC